MSPLVRGFVPAATGIAQKVDINKKYELCRKLKECVQTLNTLQSNARTLERTRQTRNKLAPLHVANMVKWASSVGISLDDIDRLKIIHVSGTKGKGSTCAYCQSILRHQGLKTGFFSSPHLVEVRERFQVNGLPLSREKFITYFWDVYTKLLKHKEENDDSMPAYFAFLTLMAFHVFIKEQTDVAIIEVGIGGQFDSTNLIRKPVVCGVTSLGLDHVSILGDTIDKIAWQKAGIFKPGIPAFTAPQPKEAMDVLYDRSKEIGCHLEVAPPFQAYHRPEHKFKLGIAGHMQKVNASLALQLTRTWMKSQGLLKEEDTNGNEETVTNGYSQIQVANAFPLRQNIIDGLVGCKWLGRNQTIKKTNLTYYLDGAHTVESIQQCVDWFKKHSIREAEGISGKVVRILVFNTTGDRDVATLLRPLKSCGFDAAVFCPNISSLSSTSADITNMTVTKDSQLQKCQHNMDTWVQLITSKRKHYETDIENEADAAICNHSNGILRENDVVNDATSSTHEKLAEYCFHGNSVNQSCDNLDQSKHSQFDSNSDIHAFKFSCIYDSLLWASHGRDNNLKDPCGLPLPLEGADHVQILVTGSIHLVGGVLGLVSDEYTF